MLILRATKKVQRYLPTSSGEPPESDTALGDLYVNRLVLDRKPLLILVSSRTLLATLAPARDVKNLPKRIPQLIEERLWRLGVDKALCELEAMAAGAVHVANTSDRSVMGSMVDFVKAIPLYVPIGMFNYDMIPELEDRLAHTPCRCKGRGEDVLWPDRDTKKALLARWGRSNVVPITARSSNH